MRGFLITAPLWLVVLLPTNGLAQYSGGPYTLTIFADEGINASSAAAQGTSSRGPNLGHVFVQLTNGEKQMYLGYYGDPSDPSRGQLRVNADLARKDYWDVKETYQITEEGYTAAHKMIDTWGRGDQPDPFPIPVILQKGTWRPWCNCGDFAEAIATVAGVQLEDLPKNLGAINRPSLWAKYLRAHGGTVNPQRQSQPASQQEASTSCDFDAKSRQCGSDWESCAKQCDGIQSNNPHKNCVEACNSALNACSNAAQLCLSR